MLRKISWIVVGGALLAGTAVLAQTPTPSSPGIWPFGSPARPGYPGYAPPGMPTVPQDPAQPQLTAPPQGMMLPPGLPSTPTMPAQPYMVTPDRLPDKKLPALPTSQVPDSAPPPISMPPSSAFLPSTDSVVLPASYVPEYPDQPMVPNEPYTLYEGKRYLSYIKEEGTRVWAKASFIHWWLQQDSYPPLVTTGNAVNLGTLGSPDTVVLQGGQFGPQEFSGFQGTLGMWLNPELESSLEASGFFLSRHGQDQTVRSDATGTPRLSIPFLAPGETVAQIAVPGVRSASITTNSVLEMNGVDFALVRNIARWQNWSFDYFGGFRYLYLNDDFTLNQNLTAIANNGVVFNGAPQVANTTILINDSFNLTNRFYGVQLGARAAWNWRRFDIGVSGKVSLGTNVNRSVINGESILNPGSAQATSARGGFFAQNSNIGTHNYSRVSTIPEGSASLGYAITPNLRIVGGYSFIYWMNVVRVGSSIDRRINPASVPTLNTFVAGSTGNPVFTPFYSDFWAHGLNIGLELKW